MKLNESLHEIMVKYLRKRGLVEDGGLQIEADDPWALKILCDLPQFPELCIRSMHSDDVPSLQDFGARLGPASKDFFCPYPWDDPVALPQALEKAVEHAVERIDAAYLMETADHAIVGYFFLWKAGGNPHSQQFQIQVPELGVAIADEFQGRGLGGLSVRLLQEISRDLHADAIELTTALENEAGWHTYLKCGFAYTGIITHPLEVDVSAATAGEVQATKYRPEKQMVYVIDDKRRQYVLDYLARKRETAAGAGGVTSHGLAEDGDV